MKHVMDGLRDHEGQAETPQNVYNLGGCRFCGHVAQKVSFDARTVVYHPGVECCAAALGRLIRCREEDIAQRKDRVQQHLDEIARLEEAVMVYGESRSAIASEARVKQGRARKGIGGRIAALEEEIEGLGVEVAKARLTRARLGHSA